MSIEFFHMVWENKGILFGKAYGLACCFSEIVLILCQLLCYVRHCKIEENNKNLLKIKFNFKEFNRGEFGKMIKI